MPDEKKITIETVHGVKTNVILKKSEESQKNVKKGVDKDDTV